MKSGKRVRSEDKRSNTNDSNERKGISRWAADGLQLEPNYDIYLDILKNLNGLSEVMSLIKIIINK